MNLSFLTHKNKITPLSIHEKMPRPRHDWFKLLIFSFVVTLSIALYSTYLFFSLLQDDSETSHFDVVLENRPSIDARNLDRAVQFIESRRVDS